jgi:hypothetical protein
MKLALCIALAAIVPAAFAQVGAGRISGTVSDNSGAVIPGAAVIVINQATQLTWKAETAANGFYVVANLPVGAYSVEIAAAGFRKAEKTGYDLTDNGRITADFALEIGAVTESVVVTAVKGETVNTVSGEVGRTVDSEQIEDLALNGRNYMQLVSMTPGVALLDEDQMAMATSLYVNNQSVNGSRVNSNFLMVDGGMNLDSGSNRAQTNNVGVDFISEVKVQSSAFSAEFGRNTGASINVITKSGGSQFHGGLHHTIRNDALDAKDYFSPQKYPFHFNDYGYSLGGPIAFGGLKKGKLFFFGGQEWKKIRRYTSPVRRTLPTRAERAGDFSDRKSTSIYYPGTKTPIPNKALSSLMTADGRAIMKIYDMAETYAGSYVDTPTSNNTVFQLPNPFNWREDILRVDYLASDYNTVYFRYLHDYYYTLDPFGTFGPSQVPTTPTVRNRPSYGPQLADTWTINPHLVNEAKINASWNGQRTPLQGTAWQRDAYGFQFPRVLGAKGLYPDGIPTVAVNSFATINGPGPVYLLTPTTDITVSDSLTYIRGQHTIKGGVMIARDRKDQNGRTDYLGSAVFQTSGNSMTTNYALADAALGQFQKYNEDKNDPVGFFRFTQYEAFIQDSWRIARNFSVEVGLRFSHPVPTYLQANNAANFDPAAWDPKQAVTMTSQGVIVPGSGNPLNGMVRPGDVPKNELARVPEAASPEVSTVPATAPRGFYPAQNLFMPRFSFAWQPFANAKTAVRGGFGTFHDRPQGNVTFTQLGTPPYSGGVQYESGNLSNPAGGTASALAAMATITAIDPHLKTPSTYSWNLGVQRELPGGLFFDITYVGNVSHHLLRKPDINFPSFALLATNYALTPRPVTNSYRPYPGYSTIGMHLSDANSNYNALQTYLTKRKGNAIMTVSYTWSHALSDSSSDDDNPDSGIEWRNRKLQYGPASFDRRHIFVFTYTYRIPLLRNRHGLLGGALGRWEISGVTRSQSGSPFDPVASSTGVTRRADYLGLPVELPADQRTPDHWFNTAAFKAAPNNQLGNAGIGTIMGPGLQVWDASLRKVFRIRESWSLRFQADAFNLMNHPNFRGLSVTTTNANYGSFSACGPARNLQAGLRLTF